MRDPIDAYLERIAALELAIMALVENEVRWYRHGCWMAGVVRDKKTRGDVGRLACVILAKYQQGVPSSNPVELSVLMPAELLDAVAAEEADDDKAFVLAMVKETEANDV